MGYVGLGEWEGAQVVALRACEKRTAGFPPTSRWPTQANMQVCRCQDMTCMNDMGACNYLQHTRMQMFPKVDSDADGLISTDELYLWQFRNGEN